MLKFRANTPRRSAISYTGSSRMRALVTKWTNTEPRRRRELIVFLILTLLLAPALAVITVGGYGFGVWMYQMIAGPPGPPPKAARPPGVVHDPQSR